MLGLMSHGDPHKDWLEATRWHVNWRHDSQEKGGLEQPWRKKGGGGGVTGILTNENRDTGRNAEGLNSLRKGSREIGEPEGLW